MRITELMDEYFDCNKQLSELQSKKERIQAEIKLEMTNNKLEVFENNGNKITYKSQKRKSLDKDKVLRFISKEELNSCYKESEFFVLKVLSKESLENMKGFMNNGKK